MTYVFKRFLSWPNSKHYLVMYSVLFNNFVIFDIVKPVNEQWLRSFNVTALLCVGDVTLVVI